MSAVIRCPRCGRPMEVPAFEGDGVYSEHHCEPEREHETAMRRILDRQADRAGLKREQEWPDE